MGMLLKYEMKKTWSMKLIILGITAVAELAFLAALLFRNSSGNTDDVIGLTAGILFALSFVGVMLIGIQSVLVLHRDMNTKQGYMLYMTPRNSYQILGAKMLENGLSMVIAGGFFFLLGLLDVTLLFSRLGQLETLWESAKKFLAMLGTEVQINTGTFLGLAVGFLTSWLATVSVAYVADIVCAALLNGKKGNGFISFLFFILLSVTMNWLQRLFLSPGMSFDTVMLTESAVALAWSVLMYFASAWIMERYLSV